MVNYQNGKIYKLVSKHSPIPYYGSTCTDLRKRLYDHKRKFEITNQYTSSQEILKLGDYKIELVENFPCKNKTELTQREDYWIKNNLCVNKRRAYLTEKEYREKDNERRKANYLKHRERELKYRKDKWEKNKHIYNKIIQCECGGSYMARTKNRHLKTKKHMSYQ